MTTVRSFLISCGLVIGSIVACLALFEILCRTIVDDGMHYHLEMWKYSNALKRISDDPRIGHEHIPDAQAHLMGVDVRINDEGLREESSMRNLADGNLRILMLGDSITFGWGIEQADTVAERLERALSMRLNRPVSVINAGVGNYNTAMEVAWFERYGLMFAPDAVILNTFINDAEATPKYEPVTFWDRFFYSRVIVFGAVDTVRRKFFGGQDWQAYYRSLYDEGADGWQAMQSSFHKLVDLCRDNAVPVVVVDYPELRQLQPYPFADISMKIETLAATEGVPFVSLLPAVQDEDPSALWVTPPDPHPNARAAALLTDYLAPKLMETLAMKP